MKDVRWLLAVGICAAGWGCGSAPSTKEAAKTTGASPASSVVAKLSPEKSGRAPVQHGIDAGANSVNRTPVKVTVEQLLAMRKKIGDKSEISSNPTHRVAPFETTTFQVDATIKSIKHEKDGDYYFVVQGDSGAQAIVEVPDPALCQGSPMLTDIVKARQELDSKFHPDATDRAVNQRATIVGVGYLGSRKRKGSGTFGSTVRLMPGTGVSFPDN